VLVQETDRLEHDRTRTRADNGFELGITGHDSGHVEHLDRPLFCRESRGVGHRRLGCDVLTVVDSWTWSSTKRSRPASTQRVGGEHEVGDGAPVQGQIGRFIRGAAAVPFSSNEALRRGRDVPTGPVADVQTPGRQRCAGSGQWERPRSEQRVVDRETRLVTGQLVERRLVEHLRSDRDRLFRTACREAGEGRVEASY